MVVSVVVVLVCAKTNGATRAQTIPIIIVFMIFPFILVIAFLTAIARKIFELRAVSLNCH